MIYGILTYALWGLFPGYFPLLEPASPVEILCHRILWAMVIMVIYTTVRRRWGELRTAGAGTWLRMAAAGFLITANWFVYILAVNSGNVADAALGYFINPLVSVLLGMIVLGERLRRLQLLAVATACVGVAYLAIIGGHPPYISLALALSFGFYGLLKKKVHVSSAGSLTAETLVIAPWALIGIIVSGVQGTATFLTLGVGHDLLLLSSGVVTAVPLLLFGLGAKSLSLSTIGMLQYLTPTMQLLWAVFITQESISAERWVAFAFIWVAVLLYLTDVVQHRPRRAAARRSAPTGHPTEEPRR
ncbi:EamA family transporter RarD [Corynebacterium uropygiale]|uniref:EamA family transporter RarD n=1 Tax=Corynebacterium uropygiale TaxID=1775911 RepID=A0A9X1U010_9CORY|nr:EamA family transporter RarD [Corynebacterium uropygiale]